MSNGFLRCKLFNSCSLRNIINLVNSFKFDLILVTESWLCSSDPDCLLLSNSQYNLHRKDRINGYGGVAVFVRNVLSIVHIDLPNDFTNTECMVLDLLEF